MTYETVSYDSNGFFTRTTSTTTYVGSKPASYSDSNPMSLFVFCHGCGGVASGDLWTVKGTNYIAISLGGRDGACWQMGTDNIRVLDAIKDVQKCFNIDTNRIYLGGYSSGGDLTYRVGFENANLFAGLLVENSDPFRDTGSTSAKLMAAASWKLNIVHCAHTSDQTYPLTTVKASMATLINNGFNPILIERPGTHWDDDKGTTGTDYDLVHSLMPYLNAGWTLNNTGATIPPVVVPPVVVPPVVVPPAVQTAVGIVKTTSTLVSPGDQGFKALKVIPDGYNVPAGTYNLTCATRTTFSDDTSAVATFILYGDAGVPYDLTWQSMDIDLRGATLGSFWDCTITGTSGVITVKPTSDTKTVKAGNKNGFGFVFTRPAGTKANYQVLVKNIVF